MDIDDIKRDLGENEYQKEMLRRIALLGKQKSSATLTGRIFRSQSEPEQKEIVEALYRLIDACDGKTKSLINLDSREKEKERIKRKHKGKLIPKKDAILYSGYSPAQFDRYAMDPDIRQDKHGGPLKPGDRHPYFHTDDLDKFARLIFDDDNNTREDALCINTNYCFDSERDGNIQFEKGKKYEIVGYHVEVVYLYNRLFDITIGMSETQFSENFRTKETHEYKAAEYNIT